MQTWFTLHGKPPHREGFTMFPMLLHPRSRGTVRLSSKNIDDPLKINPNYLAEDFDVKILVEGMLITFKGQGWDYKCPSVFKNVLNYCKRE